MAPSPGRGPLKRTLGEASLAIPSKVLTPGFATYGLGCGLPIFRSVALPSPDKEGGGGKATSLLSTTFLPYPGVLVPALRARLPPPPLGGGGVLTPAIFPCFHAQLVLVALGVPRILKVSPD
jgi:hypothetical protein